MQKGQTPRDDLAGYLVSYAHDMAFGDEDPEAIVDRHHTPDVEYVSDGMRFDRRRLIEHAQPVRRNAAGIQTDVHDALVAGDRVAARYTMRSRMRKGRSTEVEIYMFGELAPDGRLRRVEQVTRDLSGASA